jgi:hypothetical protein
VVSHGGFEVVVVEEATERERRERDVGWKRKNKEKNLTSGQLWTRFSSCSGHEIHPYL